MCVYVDESCTFSRDEWRRARKAHRCVECHRTIELKERYEYTAMLFEGSFDAVATCEQCAQWREAYADAARVVCGPEGAGWYFGQIWGHIRDFCQEHLGYDPDEATSWD